jgi:hypothetical protein
MIRQKLPGIKTLGYVEGKNLQRQMMMKSLTGLPVAIMTDITPINFVGNPTCEAASDYDNGGRIEKTTLKFITDEMIVHYPDIAFVVTDTNGESFVIGAREKPHPIIRMTISTGEPGGEPAVFSYEVTLYAQRSLIPCSV